MANCEACEEIRHLDPEFVVNGLDAENCASLGNDTGLVADSGHNDATDLNNMNDCLVGNMDDEIDLYDVCDWKEYMHQLVPNLWTMFAAIICALKGIWTNIHNIWSKISEILNDLTSLHNDITNINNRIDGIDNSITIINNTIANVPKSLMYADVSAVATIQPGYPSGQVNRVNIPAARSDGYIPIGIVGWNLSNYGSSTGVSNIYPFKVKLMGTDVSLQLTNTTNSNKKIEVEATVIYMKL